VTLAEKEGDKWAGGDLTSSTLLRAKSSSWLLEFLRPLVPPGALLVLETRLRTEGLRRESLLRSDLAAEVGLMSKDDDLRPSLAAAAAANSPPSPETDLCGV